MGSVERVINRGSSIEVRPEEGNAHVREVY